MSVFVDDMYRYPMGRYRGMKMSHMIADTEDELHEMARKIGVARKWYQGDHYDIAYSKRQLAIQHGAIEITLRQLSKMSMDKRRRRSRAANQEQPGQMAGTGSGTAEARVDGATAPVNPNATPRPPERGE